MNWDPTPQPDTAAAHQFPATRWTVVLQARAQDSSAVHWFCERYRDPVYSHFRRSGLSHEDSEDCTQAVFARLSQPEALQKVQSDRGRFRTFILACADHEASHWREARQAWKRGAGVAPISLDDPDAKVEAISLGSSERNLANPYDRDFAVALVRRAMDSLRREYLRTRQAETFDALCPYLVDPPEHGELAHLAERLRTDPNALRQSWMRLRQRYARLLKEEIEQTLSDPRDLHAELHHLLAVLATVPPSDLTLIPVTDGPSSV